MSTWIRKTVTLAVVVVAMVATLVTPAAAGGTTQISGVGYIAAVSDGVTPAWTESCPGHPDYMDFADITLELVEGNLQGCWYTLIESATASPSFEASPLVYHETGREVFVGGWYDDDGALIGTGTFETTYRFTGMFADPSFTVEIHGRCQHPIVAGTGTGVFEDMAGRVDFKDDVETGELNYRGHLE